MTEIEISKAMAQLLDELGRVATAAKEVVEAIFECGKIDKLHDEQIRELITTTLKKRELSDRTIRSYLPASLKDKRAQEIGAKGNESQKRQRQSLPQQSEIPTVKASTTLGELEYNLASDVKKALEQVKPPVEPDNINPPDEQSTDEPDDGTEYHGDARQKENLPRWIRIELTKLLPGTSVSFLKKLDICMASGGIAYFGLLDDNVIAVESAGEHLRKPKALEVRTQ